MSLVSRLLDARARQSSAAFAALALLDERTGARVTLAPHHRAMHATWRDHKRTVQLAPSEFGKSVQLAAYIAWRIGSDPSLRVGLLSSTAAQAERLLRLVTIVVNGPVFARIFGATIARSTVDTLELSTKPNTIKDPNVLAAAFDLSSMLGTRLDLACCDDIANRSNTTTQQMRDVSWQTS